MAPALAGRSSLADMFIALPSLLFAAALFHALGNVAHVLFVARPTADSRSLTGMIILVVLYRVAAIAIVWRFGPRFLAAKTAWPSGPESSSDR